MQRITVVTADVIGSRDAGIGPGSLAKKLKGIEHQHLLVPFSVSRGDEVQGIAAGWLSAPQLVRMLRWHCQPVELRIGLGIGYYEGKLGSDPWKLSGQAFFRARQALEIIADSKDPITQVVTGTEHLDALANSVWLLLDTLMGGWTPGQWEAVMTYEQEGTYLLAAEILGVAPQNVQKRCKAAHWNQIRQAEQGLSSLESLLTLVHPKTGVPSNITQKQVKEGEQ